MRREIEMGRRATSFLAFQNEPAFIQITSKIVIRNIAFMKGVLNFDTEILW